MVRVEMNTYYRELWSREFFFSFASVFFMCHCHRSNQNENCEDEAGAMEKKNYVAT